MTDLTKITTPFGLLDEGTKEALVNHKGVIEFYTSTGWRRTSCPGWNRQVAYRVKALSKPSINWDHVHPEYKWLAHDEDGIVYLYKSKPAMMCNYWDGNSFTKAIGHISMSIGECHWTDSLVQRPE